MRTNVKPAALHTHEGGIAKRINPLQQLRRSVLACLLWEDSFYESGLAIADRIKELVPRCKPEDVAALAIQARTDYKLRHAPLLLARELVRHPKAHGRLVGDTIANVIQRADEPAEFLSLYWQDGKQPLATQVKKGLARALGKFSEYQLGKYVNRPGAIRLRDVLFLCHAKPKDSEQEALWKRLVAGNLATPDTWEVALSGGADKKETFERLLIDRKLGYMALLRNLRNMQQAGVDEQLVKAALLSGAAKSKALPFRFISAARAVPAWEPMIDQALQLALAGLERLPGKTAVLVDVSYSMVGNPISKKSDLDRLDAAAALASLVAGIAEKPRVFIFSDCVSEVPPRKGMALVDAIRNAPHQNTYLGAAIKLVEKHAPGYDRMIVITDEQSADKIPDPKGVGYMINVASYRNGVGYGSWTHIDGFSEAVIQYIQALESETTELVAFGR